MVHLRPFYRPALLTLFVLFLWAELYFIFLYPCGILSTVITRLLQQVGHILSAQKTKQPSKILSLHIQPGVVHLQFICFGSSALKVHHHGNMMNNRKYNNRQRLYYCVTAAVDDQNSCLKRTFIQIKRIYF